MFSAVAKMSMHKVAEIEKGEVEFPVCHHVANFGLSVSFRNICGKSGVQAHFKGANTVNELLVVLKEKASIIQKGGVIYIYGCNQPRCTMK